MTDNGSGNDFFLEENHHRINLTVFRTRLIEWGHKNFRSFPWRETRNPYQILISEVMLHRTQARQVVPVYEEFIERYSDIGSLSKASKEQIHKIMYPLGLRWRTELMINMATILSEKYGEEVPKDREGLLSLPGVSDYIAGAVRCFAWDLSEPLADTNTVRVVGRVFGLEIMDSSRRNSTYKELLAALVSRDDSRNYNYSLLDLADKVCLKRNEPDCEHCPILQMCSFGIANRSL